MDRIIIEDLQVYAHHGVAQEEKRIGQMFFVSLRIGMDLEKAAANDTIDSTLNYADLCDDVQRVMQSAKYDLIETAAMRIIEYLFQAYVVIQEIHIILKKPWAPMGHHLQYAAVELERQRGDRNVW